MICFILLPLKWLNEIVESMRFGWEKKIPTDSKRLVLSLDWSSLLFKLSQLNLRFKMNETTKTLIVLEMTAVWKVVLSSFWLGNSEPFFTFLKFLFSKNLSYTIILRILLELKWRVWNTPPPNTHTLPDSFPSVHISKSEFGNT